MQFTLTKMDIWKLRRRLARTRLAALAAIELGDCRAVAKLTCEAGRIRNALSLAGIMFLEPLRS